jgi:hypothetical protein
MAYLMREGKGKGCALYTRCASEEHCKAELLLLLEKVPSDGKPVVGYYDVDPTLPVEKFMESYQGKQQEEINRMLVKVRLGGFNFKQVGIPKLVMGVDQPKSTKEQTQQRISDLRATVAYYLPDLVPAIEQIAAANDKSGKTPFLLLHQDSFAAGYHMDEYTLLGMAIKYAGLRGVNIHIIVKP